MENSSFGLKNVIGGLTDKSTLEIKGFGIFSACIFFSTIIVGVIGNGLVIFLAGCRMKTTVNSIWFLNLAIADFIFLLFSVTNFCLILSNQHSDLTYIFIFIAACLNLFVSVWFLVVISLDRCLCTWMAVWAQNNRTLRKARIICIIIWVSSIGYILPFLNVFEITVTIRVTYGFIVDFLIPFLTIASSYIAIGVKVKRLKKRKQLRSYRLIITVILTFFICSFPQHVCYFWMVRAENNNWTLTDQFWKLFAFTLYLVNLNSSLNPFLYVFMCEDYKKKLKQSLVLVLETAFAEDHLDNKEMRQTQDD
ncbi:C3a anaphylatoxin chemotactic receptor-like [Danio rerio]|uniref:C3a anaphylatoxin chemotactic receptor-like n=1 Tax=Danio rerio TaxID=7955 RepID=A0A8M9PCI4_DANRE|nr:C3a anaphylatoxin chemotactic receptor-like [Danio rerio]|eukprot:XP_021322149.1 C3a anaphylatoxin chemotactic receptor-like [Danio rerio]